jgi:hypothetical protein
MNVPKLFLEESVLKLNAGVAAVAERHAELIRPNSEYSKESCCAEAYSHFLFHYFIMA